VTAACTLHAPVVGSALWLGWLFQVPVSKRVVAMLDGESLLNDATALVLDYGTFDADVLESALANLDVEMRGSFVS
jgi:NhaP-type Na+/H+ or K+/H+ antiporter